MNKIKLAVTGCLGRMGQQIIKSSKLDRKFKLVTLTESRKIYKKVSGIKPELNNESRTNSTCHSINCSFNFGITKFFKK